MYMSVWDGSALASVSHPVYICFDLRLFPRVSLLEPPGTSTVCFESAYVSCHEAYILKSGTMSYGSQMPQFCFTRMG